MKGVNQTTDSEHKIIAENIRKIMDAHSISESQLAKALDVSVMTIRRVVSGETADPRISTLSSIANYFDINIDDLLKKNIMPIQLITKKSSYFVPILKWHELADICLNDHVDFSKLDNWYHIGSSSINLGKNSFALHSKPSLEPRYPEGALLIIDPCERPLDNDVLLIKSKNDHSISLRELQIDSPKWVLKPIISGSEFLFYNTDDFDIMGVVILTIFNTRK